MATGATAINELAIALAFGLSIVAMAYGVDQISGCHIIPAVSFGVFAAGRVTVYWLAQVAGAVVAALVLYLLLSGKKDPAVGVASSREALIFSFQGLLPYRPRRS